MFINLKDSLEYRQEFLEWENLYFRLRVLIEKRPEEKWKNELKYLENWWTNWQIYLKNLYQN